ncbi:glucose 1-dehydrogenase [Sphingobium sp.]|uniref:glucose 1-dehydrogenase n=1 Tax=Sphingobium sp. TaxID=1912891 RepID=UPI0028BF09C8|nr:glucose 1-dehydrogenase [Sphingobium sp.]
MERLKGKTALITGGARGMGASHARAFVREGAAVIITDLLEEEGTALVSELGDAASFIRHDVTRSTDWKAVEAQVKDRFGTLDILVNNAAIGHLIRFDELTEDEFRRFFEINQLSVFHGTKAAVALMDPTLGGSIVNISSVAGITAAPDGFAYIASKFAVRGMTKSAALDLAKRKIRVNSVHPGMIRTPMLAGTDMADDLMHMIPLGRLGDPADITNIVIYLGSDESSYCTGAEFVVDGGWTAQ